MKNTIQYTIQDVNNQINLFFKPLQTENRYELKIIIQKRKKTFTVNIGDKNINFNYYEFRDFINVLFSWFNRIKELYFEKEEKPIGSF